MEGRTKSHGGGRRPPSAVWGIRIGPIRLKISFDSEHG